MVSDKRREEKRREEKRRGRDEKRRSAKSTSPRCARGKRGEVDTEDRAQGERGRQGRRDKKDTSFIIEIESTGSIVALHVEGDVLADIEEVSAVVFAELNRTSLVLVKRS